MDDFLQLLKKVVRIVLYRPTINQSDCRKACPYQLPSDNGKYRIKFEVCLLGKVSSFPEEHMTVASQNR